MARRMDSISAEFMGWPYVANPLIGSAESPEVFTAATIGFDCVTYVETVLARAVSTREHEFEDALRRIRYAGGKISWKQRNHYMTQWIRNNTRSGCLRGVTGLTASVHKERILDVVPGLPARRTKFDCIPKQELLKHSDLLKTGDLAFFVSTRRHLDVFHCGILVNSSNELRMRHASKSRGRVIEQSLAEFLKQNRMAGVIVARPAVAE